MRVKQIVSQAVVLSSFIAYWRGLLRGQYVLQANHTTVHEWVSHSTRSFLGPLSTVAAVSGKKCDLPFDEFSQRKS